MLAALAWFREVDERERERELAGTGPAVKGSGETAGAVCGPV
jgi:hypothetical protein